MRTYFSNGESPLKHTWVENPTTAMPLRNPKAMSWLGIANLELSRILDGF